MSKTNQKIPNEDHLVRYIKPSKLVKDENDNVVGMIASAFSLREGESNLSATWMEYFNGGRIAQLHAAVNTIRNSNFKVGKNSGFAVGNVGEVHDVCIRCGKKIHILHDPEPDNPAHVSIKSLPEGEEDILFELLASDAWSDLHLNCNIP